SENHAKRIPTNILNDVIMDALAMNPNPTVKGKKLKVLYATQVAVKPPSIVVFVNDPELMHFSYQRFLENKIREAFGFVRTPIKILARKRHEGGNKHGESRCIRGRKLGERFTYSIGR